MHIKRIEIQGFKTFADRTELELTSGITSIVGPNGTGKSNIADAIAWVLGEQNVRNLRGLRSQDVIFSGSERRKPVGMAEVALTIDNSCGTLPIEFSEVTVARRTFRSGESDYLINKVPCRLRDIYELFLDTGMGREAYSMVSQGEIDAILSAKSEDRRSLFEEAAGIKKYRFRRKEAAKKLENTEANLQRVNDIIAELSGQVEPLAEQAEAAARYSELDSRLREIETGLLVHDLRRWSEELERVRQARAEGSKQAGEQDRRISELESDKDEIGGQLSDLDRRVDAARAKQQEANAAAQRAKGRLALVEERQRAAEEAHNRLETQIQQLEGRIREAESRLDRLHDEEAGCADRETRLVQDVSERTRALEEVSADLASAARIVDDRKAAYFELARDQAAKRTELESLRARGMELEAAVAKFAAELASLEDGSREAARKQEEAARRAEELRTRAPDRERELSALSLRRDEAQARMSAAGEEVARSSSASVGKASRLATLKEMAEAHEGFFEGVRAVMDAWKNHKLGGHYAVVADVITVPAGFETAIEVALGSGVQDIITHTVEEAKRAIRYLKENRAGRATFLPLSGIRPTMSTTVGDLKQPGVKGIAGDLITFRPEYAPAINVLLGRVIVVDTIDNAVKLARSAAGWGRIVTLDGEVIVPTGAMTGGIRPGKGPNLLGRTREIDALTRELALLEQARAKAEKELSSARDEVTGAEQRIEELEHATASDRLALAEVEREIEFLAQEHNRLDGQTEVVRAEKQDAEAALANDSAAVSALAAQLSGAGKENVDLDELVAGAQKRVEELSGRRAALSEELMEMSVTLASVRERRAGIEQAMLQHRAAISEMESERTVRRDELEQHVIEAAVKARERDALLTQSDGSEGAVNSAQQELDHLVARRGELALTASSADGELKALHHARSETAELVRDCDVREARLEVQIAQTSERLMEEYEITAEEALAREVPVEVERGTAAEVTRLRREIKAMGPVNTGAVQEYERIRERWEFLTMQRNDLEDARTKLLDGIREIDESTRELFMSTFRAVGEEFGRMFNRLFGGGRTELVLTDPSNLLETGVEVIVQLPGKKLQNLVVLSGGERALTASALLFALLRVKPSPFVVFDEVDAPLDDTNVERFVEVLREFAAASQFVVITHNRATMEASDTLYGVTMQEPGVSKLISLRLAEEPERRETGAEVVAQPVG